MATHIALIQMAARTLEKAGIESPRREARLLVALAGRFETADLIAFERDMASTETCIRLEAFLARRLAHEPFAHISGRRGFYGLDFNSDARALVPRPDSEIVVETVLEKLPRGKGVSVADLGTGSGCLLIAILATRGGVNGLGIERDPGAASLARENVKRHELDQRAEILVTDWVDWRDWGDFDLIVSNPPYIASEEIEGLAPDVRLYDPMQALDGGPDGLAAYRSITALAAAQMKPGAWLVFEIGFDQDAAVRGLLAAHDFAGIGGARDLGSRDRVVFGHRPHG